MMPGQIIITEFPFWTFLFADLHAHLIAIPFAVLAIGLSLNLVAVAANGFGLGRPTLWVQLVFLALVVGSLAAINTWDYPTYLLLALAALFLASYAVYGHLGAKLLWSFALGAGALVALSYAAFLPFHLRNESFTGIGY
jgi:uncharacterized membrane protein